MDGRNYVRCNSLLAIKVGSPLVQRCHGIMKSIETLYPLEFRYHASANYRASASNIQFRRERKRAYIKLPSVCVKGRGQSVSVCDTAKRSDGGTRDERR